jgi:hypothetical protein
MCPIWNCASITYKSVAAYTAQLLQDLVKGGTIGWCWNWISSITPLSHYVKSA